MHLRDSVGSVDAIIIGGGVMGAACAAALTARGWAVVVLEAGRRGEPPGSSGGGVKGFRKAYFHDPRLVALAEEAQGRWRALEAEAGEPLLALGGGLVIGPAADPMVRAFGEALVRHRLPHERLDDAALAERYPSLIARRGDVGWLELEAGTLQAEGAVRALLAVATGRGARVVERAAAQSFERRGREWVVGLAGGGARQYRARHLVLAPGPWLSQLLRRPGPLHAPGLAAVFTLERQVPAWAAAPAELAELPMLHAVVEPGPDGTWYAFGPGANEARLKVCRYHGGARVGSVRELDRKVTEADLAGLQRFLKGWLPLAGPPRDAWICANTLTRHGEFVIGPHPRAGDVVVVGGFGGHGFKFAPVVGELVAELLLTGRPRPDATQFLPPAD